MENLKTVAPGATTVQTESPEILILRENLKKSRIALANADPDSVDYDGFFNAVKIAGDAIKMEIANQQKLKQAALVQELRNEKTLFVTNFETAVKELNAVLNEKKSTEDQKGTAHTNYDGAKEKLLNLVLGNLSKNPAADLRVSGAPKGNITAAIRELIIPMYAAGKSGKDVRDFIVKEKGFNDGTANATILSYEKEIGLK